MKNIKSMEEYINTYIRERLMGDGGEIEFVSFEGGVVTVILRGECSKCLILERCLKWIEQRIALDMGQEVTVSGIRKKPYFQDT